MKVRIDYLKLPGSYDFGAFANKTFTSVAIAKAWIAEHIPERELDLVKVSIAGHALCDRDLSDITGK